MLQLKLQVREALNYFCFAMCVDVTLKFLREKSHAEIWTFSFQSSQNIF